MSQHMLMFNILSHSNHSHEMKIPSYNLPQLTTKADVLYAQIAKYQTTHANAPSRIEKYSR